ncbi:MAG: aspartate/glutamate racemase family protein, partial [Lachnospiraceae bacterium]|nr:aspartate/glutamate racemase family protein [Lachnospiraceae bacterium]
MNLLGIIGGLGPMATAYFMEQIIGMTDVPCDQEHIPMIIYNCPYIPDRTRHILGLSKDDPSVPMLEAGKKLVGDGVDEIAIPCITASYYHATLNQQLPIPVLNGIRETAEYLEEQK